MTEQQIRPGQVWRRKKDGRHIRIYRQQTEWSDDLVEVDADDWVWQGEDYKGRGFSYGKYIRRDYELVKESGA